MSTLFYRNPVLLNAGQHAAVGLREIRDFSFARTANAIPVNLVEFPLVARHYPIAFVGSGNDLYPAAIVGLKEGNLFIDGEGQWKPGCYIPAYVRRYPFIFADDKDRGLLSLCVDDEVLTQKGGQPLFEDDKPSAATDRALEFCKSYHAAALPTQEFAKAVMEQDVLSDRQATAQLNSGGSFVLTGFKTIDAEKLGKLSGEVLGQWNLMGWLQPVFTMAQSMTNWGELVDLLAATDEASARKSRKAKN
jgi:hypothetical protein